MIDLNSNEMVDLSNQALGPVQKKIDEFNKKALGIGWTFFKKALATASEPFFRKAMGERYMDQAGVGGGLLFWVGGSVAAYFFPIIRSASGLLSEMSPALKHLGIFNHPLFPLITGGLMTLLYFRFVTQNVALMLKYRIEEIPYHTRSRGVPRWGEHGRSVFLVMLIVLVLTDLPVAVLFVMAVITNANVRAEQEAAIMSRYFDALDQEVENKNLENAALGRCPTEITYLTKPIPNAYKETMRENIAAALVGKPVKIAARRPQPKSGANSPTDAASTPPTAEKSGLPEEEGEATPTPKTRTRLETVAAAAPKAKTPEGFRPLAAAIQMIDRDPEKFAKLSRDGRILRWSVHLALMLTAIALLGYGYFRLFRSHASTPPPVVARADLKPAEPERPQPTQPIQSPPTDQPPQPPPVANLVTPPVTNLVIPPVPNNDTPPPAARVQDTEAGKLLTLYSSKLSVQTEALQTFTNFCETAISEQTDKLARLSSKLKPALSAHLQHLQSTIHSTATAQAGFLSRTQLRVIQAKNDGPEKLQITFATLGNSVSNLVTDRESLRNELVRLGVSIDNAALRK